MKPLLLSTFLFCLCFSVKAQKHTKNTFKLVPVAKFFTDTAKKEGDYITDNSDFITIVGIESKYYAYGYHKGQRIYLPVIANVDNEQYTAWLRKSINAKYGRYCFEIQNGIIQLGMPSEVVAKIKGIPKQVNRTILLNSRSEQWVYGESNSMLLYFKNGYLTGIQD